MNVLLQKPVSSLKSLFKSIQFKINQIKCTSLTFVLSDVCLTFVPSYVFRADVCTYKLSLAVQCTVIVKFKMIILLLKDNSSFDEVGSELFIRKIELISIHKIKFLRLGSVYV